MKILVTGGCGFLGSHICEYYKKKREDVIALDNLTKYELMRTGYNAKAARNYNVNFLKKIGVKMIKGDIRNKNLVMKTAQNCDYIVHTAAQPAMTVSIEQPELDFTTNVVGIFNLLEAARKYNIPLVNSSTIHVYGNAINETIKKGKDRFFRNPSTIPEDYPIMQGKITPLHASKRSAELLVQTYIDTYDIKAANFRLTGMYGPRQFGGEDHGWVANFAIRTLLGLPIKIYGTDKQVRDILYVSDAVTAFDAFYKSSKSGTYNIGGGKDTIISLKECLKMIKETVKTKQNISFEPARLGDLWYFACNITKADKEINWQPSISPKEGVKILIKWIKENIEIFKK